jgi:hypothetical protein
MQKIYTSEFNYKAVPLNCVDFFPILGLELHYKKVSLNLSIPFLKILFGIWERGLGSYNPNHVNRDEYS